MSRLSFSSYGVPTQRGGASIMSLRIMPCDVIRVIFASARRRVRKREPAFQTEVVKFERCGSVCTPCQGGYNENTWLVALWEM